MLPSLQRKSTVNIKLNSIINRKYLPPMGCSSSQAAEAAGKLNDKFETNESNDNSKTVEITGKYPPAEAFVIPLNDGDDIGDTIDGNKQDSLIKKHPPKRLQRLLDEQPNLSSSATATTIEDLEDKLAKAEIRRQQYLQQKVDTVILLAQPNKQDDKNDKKTTPENDNEDNDVDVDVDVVDDDNDDDDDNKKNTNNNNNNNNNDKNSRSPGDGDDEQNTTDHDEGGEK